MAYGNSVRKLNPCEDSLILDLLLSAVPRPSPLLDIGCGRGDRLRALSTAAPDLNLFGIDLEEETCRYASSQCPSAQIITGNAQRLPFKAASFRSVLCECTLSLLEAPLIGLKEIHRVLLPDGLLILSDLYYPDTLPLRISFSQTGFLRSIFSATWYLQAASSFGFSVLSFHDCKEEFLAYAAQMILDGSFCEEIPFQVAAALRQNRTGYGLWVLKKEAADL